MKVVKVVLFTVALFLASASSSRGQGQDHVQGKFEGWCDSLRNAPPADLVQFLNGVVPDENNARCVTWAIHRLGEERYEPAIAPLVKLLAFRRPESRNEEIFFSLSQELFPAEVALERIGAKAEPEVLRAIEAESTSATARDNAVAVWMVAYQSDHPEGVAALNQEEVKAVNDAAKKRLASAIQKALSYCGPQEIAACRKAAVTKVP